MDSLPDIELPSTALCFFFTEHHERLMLPIQSTHYDVRIQNNFAEITSTQIYKNPFTKNL